MQIVMFTIGSVIFIAYMFGLLTMINRSHKEQEQEFKNLSNKADEMDMDGMGNFSRFPIKQRRMEEFGYRKIYGNELKKYMKTKKKEKV